MGYDIGPKIGIQGEKEFNDQIKAINNSLREYGSEMKALTSKFADNANSQDALTEKTKLLEKQYDTQKQKSVILQEQYEKQTKKLRELAEAYQSATKENGENSAEASKAQAAFNRQAESVSKLKVAVNETENYMNQLERAVVENKTALSEMDAGTRDAVTGLSKLEDAAEDAGNELGNIGDKIDTGLLMGAADTFSGLADSALQAAEESKEFMKIMGQLETSSSNLGYTNEETQATFRQLYGILGDDQTAATTTANLQALGLSQGELQKMTEGVIGAWAQYGDSIPIDSLSEAVNETAQVGKVTGTFADVLNWAGMNEDQFNEKLASCSSESERANLIMQTLASQGLMDSAEAFRDNNKELIENNESTMEYQKTMAELAKKILPILTITTDAISGIIDLFNNLPKPLQGILIGVIGVLTAIAKIAPVVAAVKAIGIGGAISGIATTITGTVIPAIGSALAAIVPVIPVILGIVAAITAIILIIKNWGAISEWFQELWKKVSNKCEEIWNEICSFFTDTIPAAFEKFKNSTMNTFRNVVSGIKSTISKVGTTVSEGFQSAIDFITGLPQKALQWGKDFIGGIIDGIKSMVGKVTSAVSGVAEKISSFLHFSRPDEGPLRDYETWMPDFMSGLARGIEKNKKMVQDAVAGMAANITAEGNGIQIETPDYSGVMVRENVTNVSVYLGQKKFDSYVVKTVEKGFSRKENEYMMAKGKKHVEL